MTSVTIPDHASRYVSLWLAEALAAEDAAPAEHKPLPEAAEVEFCTLLSAASAALILGS
jgi:hypothetical protein